MEAFIPKAGPVRDLLVRTRPTAGRRGHAVRQSDQTRAVHLWTGYPVCTQKSPGSGRTRATRCRPTRGQVRAVHTLVAWVNLYTQWLTLGVHEMAGRHRFKNRDTSQQRRFLLRKVPNGNFVIFFLWLVYLNIWYGTVIFVTFLVESVNLTLIRMVG